MKLLRGHKSEVEVKAAGALESLADNNYLSQQAFLDLDAPEALMRLLKVS